MDSPRQSQTAVIRLKNESSLPLTARLVGPYEEREGRKFRIGTGIYVALRFSLYGAGDPLSDPIWEEEVGGFNDDEVRVNLLNASASFRANSLGDLKKNLDLFGLELSQWKP